VEQLVLRLYYSGWPSDDSVYEESRKELVMTSTEIHTPGWRLYAVMVFVLALGAAALTPTSASASDDGVEIDVIVREAAPETDAAETLVEELGGTVGEQLAIIGGFTAEVPTARASDLEADDSVVSVSLNASLQLLGGGWEDASGIRKYQPNKYNGSMYNVAVNDTYTAAYWNAGYTGQGVDIALIDSGVVAVDGLTVAGKVVNGPDLSFESQNEDFRYLDTYGHGTHMAGIIAGRDTAVSGNPTLAAKNHFVGMAPDARIVSIKVAGHDGATDVSQVIAAIDWVVQHRNDNGMNIRVLNLSFGTDSTQDYTLDPLAFAVEQAWNAGIVVVVAAGNAGNDSPLRSPATDPFVIAVGAADGHGGQNSRMKQTDFSSCGDWTRPVDLLAPGKSIVSLRNPGSHADDNYPEATVSDRWFLGSGTSQAAAVVSGAAAVVIEQRPDITPDQLKKLLTDNATHLRSADSLCRGAGLLNLWDSYLAETPSAAAAEQTHTPATGLGSLEASRGTDHVGDDGVVLEGEQDIFGNAWDGASWSTASAAGASWSGGEWNGASWSGASWSGASWSGASWSGASWSGASWSGASWSGASWSSKSWSGESWSGASWSGASWSGASWSGNAWLGLSWD
jgi:serine protease AprX